MKSNKLLKTLSISLVASMSFTPMIGFASCSKKSKPTPPGPTPTKEVTINFNSETGSIEPNTLNVEEGTTWSFVKQKINPIPASGYTKNVTYFIGDIEIDDGTKFNQDVTTVTAIFAPQAEFVAGADEYTINIDGSLDFTLKSNPIGNHKLTNIKLIQTDIVPTRELGSLSELSMDSQGVATGKITNINLSDLTTAEIKAKIEFTVDGEYTKSTQEIKLINPTEPTFTTDSQTYIMYEDNSIDFSISCTPKSAYILKEIDLNIYNESSGYNVSSIHSLQMDKNGFVKGKFENIDPLEGFVSGNINITFHIGGDSKVQMISGLTLKKAINLGFAIKNVPISVNSKVAISLGCDTPKTYDLNNIKLVDVDDKNEKVIGTAVSQKTSETGNVDLVFDIDSSFTKSTTNVRVVFDEKDTIGIQKTNTVKLFNCFDFNFNTTDKTASIKKGKVLPTGDIDMPSSVLNSDGAIYKITSIPNSAFTSCSELNSLRIPDSVTTLGEDAFNGCSQLKKVNIGSKIKNISNGAFINCVQLENLDLGEQLISIGENAFASCWGLKTIKIPKFVESIGNFAFYGCCLEHVYFLGTKINTIGDNAFGYNYLSDTSGPKITPEDDDGSPGVWYAGQVSDWKLITRGSNWHTSTGFATITLVYCIASNSTCDIDVV